MKVGVIGLGTMGTPMAENLLLKGFEVVVHNRTREREEPLANKGARRAESPQALAREVDVVLTSVSDTHDVEAVLLNDRSAAIHGLRNGSLVVDTSTISPDGARRIAEALCAKGSGFVDAPVSGGSEGAIKASLAIMCGGTKEDFERALPVLQAIGGRITRVGPSGCGQIAKAVNQVIIAGTYQSVAEGLVLAFKCGADPAKVIEAIKGGAAASWILENRAGNMQNDRYPLGFRVRLHRKDLAIALAAARAAQVPLPVASFIATMEDALIALGHGDEDVSALARIVRTGAAVPDGPMT